MKAELYRSSETVFIKRSQINFAPYNPKKHSKERVKAIKDDIKRVAFLGGIIWNTTTGNLIDGHKRLMALDTIHKYDGNNDYDIKVERIELDEKTEKEQNIFQTASVTELDSGFLAEMIGEIDYNLAGLTDEDLKLVEVEVPDFVFTKNTDGEKAFAEIKQDKEIRKQEMQAKRKANKQKTFEGANYVTITFSDFEAKAYFMERFGFDHYDEFIKGERFDKMIERVQ